MIVNGFKLFVGGICGNDFVVFRGGHYRTGAKKVVIGRILEMTGFAHAQEHLPNEVLVFAIQYFRELQPICVIPLTVVESGGSQDFYAAEEKSLLQFCSRKVLDAVVIGRFTKFITQRNHLKIRNTTVMIPAHSARFSYSS